MVGTVSPVMMSALQPNPLFRMNLSTFARTSADCQFMLAIVTAPQSAANAALAQARVLAAMHVDRSKNFMRILRYAALIDDVTAAPRHDCPVGDRGRCQRNSSMMLADTSVEKKCAQRCLQKARRWRRGKGPDTRAAEPCR